MRSIDMQCQQQVRCRYNMCDMLCMSRMSNANVGMLAHFVLGRAMEGKSRQDKTRQDKTRQEIAAEEIYGPYRPMAPKRSEINA